MTQVTSAGNSGKVEWALTEGEGQYLARLPFEASFQWRGGLPLEFGDDGAEVPRRTMTFAFPAIAIPTLCRENEEVCVQLPFRVGESDRRHWEATLRFLDLSDTTLTLAGSGPDLELKYRRPPADPNRPGLFYGGGVESNAALSSLLERSPLLLTTEGPVWRTNQTDANIGITPEPEDRLCDRFVPEMLRARSNARQVSYLAEPALRCFCSGVIFTWLAAAAGFRLGTGQFFISQQLEYTLQRDHADLSINPDPIFGSTHSECPMVVPIFGWAAKAELLERLKDTDLPEYVYSCPHNRNKRWCGGCGVCWRMAQLCDLFGVPIERLNMDTRPTYASGSSRRHTIWRLLTDHLCPKPGGPTVKPWLLPVSEQVIAHLAEHNFCEAEGGEFQTAKGQLTIAPGTGGEASLRFPGW